MDRRTDRNRMTDDTDQQQGISVRDDGDSVKLGEQPAWIKWSFYITLLFIVLAGLYILGKAIPWEPLHIYGYTPEPIEACPFDHIEVMQEVELTSPLASLDSLSGTTYWINEEGRPWGGNYFSSSAINIDLPRGEYPSSTLRFAPPQAGEWYPAGEGTLTGHRLGFIGVTQQVDVQTDEPVVVKEWSDPECVEKRMYGG